MRPFKGTVNLDIRESKPDSPAFLADKAAAGSPNILVILFDDTGCAAWGAVWRPDQHADTPEDRRQWPHLFAMAHHCALFADAFLLSDRAQPSSERLRFDIGKASGFPGYNSHLPAENAPMAMVLRDAGWSTFWVGKNHTTPIDEFTMGASKKNWPLGQGYDRFYGFNGGETNNWYADLIEDNHFVDQPYQPEDGYHLSKDLTDKALSFIRDAKQSEPNKPWYLWFCPGANHAPHHAPQEYIDRYKGKFDDGYEAYREWVLPRMIQKGILPKGTELTPINPMREGTYTPGDAVRPWNTLSTDEKRLFSRMAEVYAGFSEYTDAQVGRIIDYLEESGQLDNTLIFYCSDNGASGEGSPNGSVNEGKFFNGYPDEIKENLALIDKLGSPATYGHYPTGWAVAFSTPFRMFKRYTYQGGACCPLVISGPKGIKARNEVRDQYHHATDIVPTILNCCGVKMPEVVNNVKQNPLVGVSMRYTFEDAKAPTKKVARYYEMLGNRGIWRDGWKAVTEHGPFSGMGNFDKDRWQLFHTEVDRSEANDVAEQHPDKVKELVGLWFEEAKKYNVLPLIDYSIEKDLQKILDLEYKLPVTPSGRYTFYPGTLPVPERSTPNVHGVSYKILAQIAVTKDPQGVIFAQGSKFGGHALFIKNGKLTYTYNFLGIPPEQRVTAAAPGPGKHVIGVEFTKTRMGQYHESHGPLKLYVDDKIVAESEIRTMTGHFSLCGEGLCIGYDSGDSVSGEYKPKFEFTGGHLVKVIFDVANDAYVDVERHMGAALARD